MTITISSKTDLVNYVNDCCADFVSAGLAEALVEAIQAEDHPAWGDDWEEWLSTNIEIIKSEAVDSTPCKGDPAFRLAVASTLGSRCALDMIEACPLDSKSEDGAWLTNVSDPLLGDWEVLEGKILDPTLDERNAFAASYKETVANAIKESGRDK
jgi:hypothetical protein